VGEEKLSEEQATRLNSLLALGDPHAEVALAYRVKERLRDFYRCWDLEEARAMLDDLQTHCLKKAMPPEIRKLGRTLKEWFDKICNYHLARITNAPTEALNNLISGSNESALAFATSRITASEPCSTLENRTGGTRIDSGAVNVAPPESEELQTWSIVGPVGIEPTTGGL